MRTDTDRTLDYCKIMSDKQTDRAKTAGGKTQSFGLLQKTDKQTDRKRQQEVRHRALDYCRRQTRRHSKDSRGTDTDRALDYCRIREADRQSKDNRKTDTELRATAEDRAKTAGGQTQTELWTTEANVQTTFQS